MRREQLTVRIANDGNIFLSDFSERNEHLLWNRMALSRSLGGIQVSKRQKIYFRVAKGALVPADSYAASQLRERGYNINDLLSAELTKPRNPKFNRLVHRIGQMVVANIEGFAGLEAHKAIKRLQLEGKVACDEIGYMVPNYGMLTQIVPRSLSNESMDEGEYKQAARGICRTISERYWPTLSEEKIAEMAEMFVGEV